MIRADVSTRFALFFIRVMCGWGIFCLIYIPPRPALCYRFQHLQGCLLWTWETWIVETLTQIIVFFPADFEELLLIYTEMFSWECHCKITLHLHVFVYMSEIHTQNGSRGLKIACALPPMVHVTQAGSHGLERFVKLLQYPKTLRLNPKLCALTLNPKINPSP